MSAINVIGGVVGGGGGGETNTASNVGTGQGVFKQKTGVNFELKKILAGANVTVTTVDNDIVIASTGGGGGGGAETVQTFTTASTIDNSSNQIDFASGKFAFIERDGATQNLVTDVFTGLSDGERAIVIISNTNGSTNTTLTFQTGEISLASSIIIESGLMLALEIVAMDSKLIFSTSLMDAV